MRILSKNEINAKSVLESLKNNKTELIYWETEETVEIIPSDLDSEQTNEIDFCIKHNGYDIKILCFIRIHKKYSEGNRDEPSELERLIIESEYQSIEVFQDGEQCTLEYGNELDAVGEYVDLKINYDN